VSRWPLLGEGDRGGGGVSLLLETKLRGFSPSPEMIVRPRLSARLIGSDASSFVLFAAPPGFGKTTLLAQWRALDERPFAWFTADSSDNDPVALWTGIIEAIRRVRPDFGDAAEVALQARHVDVHDALIPVVVRELESLQGELVLVLDDYQAVDNAACHASLAYFMEAMPKNLQFVIASRADPPIPVAKLRAEGRLLELRALDLCFTKHEETVFLNEQLALGLGPESLEILHERTEGWPAGVYLASLSLRQSPDPDGFVSAFDGSNRHIVDYLTEVVLGSLDARQRDFLLQTSILDSFSAPLCDAVTGRRRSAARLAELERANLFLIPLDDRRERYRYHQLFADLLRAQLEEREPGLVPKLHKRAYEWLAEAGETDAAVRHALSAGEVDAAAELVAGQWLADPHAHLGRGDATVRRLDGFNAEAIAEDPRLVLLQGWALSMSGKRAESDEALAIVQGAEEKLPDGTTVGDAATVVRACFFRGDTAGALAAAEAASALADRLPASWHPVLALALGRARYLAGDGQGAESPLEWAVSSGHHADRPLFAATAQALLARIALAGDDVDLAEQEAQAAVASLELQNLADQPGAGTAYVALGAVVARRGRTEEAGDLLVRGLARLRRQGDVREIADALLVFAPVRRALVSLASARTLVEEARLLLGECADPGAVGVELEEVARSLTPAHRRINGESDLTERELEVLRYLAEGIPKRDIGTALFLSYNTIHSHTKSIYQKLRVSSRDAAVARARELGAL
jgi:LuxR family transcriptional regulator, maltose regulon positive regulatory protein